MTAPTPSSADAAALLQRFAPRIRFQTVGAVTGFAALGVAFAALAASFLGNTGIIPETSGSLLFWALLALVLGLLVTNGLCMIGIMKLPGVVFDPMDLDSVGEKALLIVAGDTSRYDACDRVYKVLATTWLLSSAALLIIFISANMHNTKLTSVPLFVPAVYIMLTSLTAGAALFLGREMSHHRLLRTKRALDVISARLEARR